MKERPQKANKSETIRKLTLPNGLQVGIINLEAILGEVSGLELDDHELIKTELLARVKDCNYIPSSAEKTYASVLLEEYLNKYDDTQKSKRIIHKKPHDR